MNAEKEIVCGADIHRDFLVATMISRSGLKLQQQFGMDEDGLLAFRSWILDHRCRRVAVESTGNYWYREALVNARSKLKNQIHQLLAVCCIKLSSVISDSFGKSGRYIVERLLEGKTIEQIISGIPSKRVRKKADELRKAIRNSLDPVQVLLIKTNLDAIDYLSEKIKLLDAEIAIKVKPFEEDLNIILSVPGI
jgi:transposase